MFFPTCPPVEINRPLYHLEQYTVTGIRNIFSVEFQKRQNIMIEGISSGFPFQGTGNPTIEFISEARYNWSSGQISLAAISTPASREPGFAQYSGYIPINFPYFISEGLTVELSNFGVAVPSNFLFDLLFWCRSAKISNPFQGL